MNPLIQPVVNLLGLAILTMVLSIVPIMASQMVIKQLYWWGLGDAE